MPLYSADQVIDKMLFARQPVKLKRVPEDSANVIYVVPVGAAVGKVYSWLDIKPGIRTNLYWMFYDSNGKPYYAEHKEGLFDLGTLREQGAVSVKEQVEAERAKAETLKETIMTVLKWGGIGLGVVILGKAFIQKGK